MHPDIEFVAIDLVQAKTPEAEAWLGHSYGYEVAGTPGVGCHVLHAGCQLCGAARTSYVSGAGTFVYVDSFFRCEDAQLLGAAYRADRLATYAGFISIVSAIVDE